MDAGQRKRLIRLQALCVRREYCTRDLWQKVLKSTAGDVSAAQVLMDALLSDGFVDDARYAAAFAREKSALSGWGPAKIRFALRAKKIPEDILEEALAGIDAAQAGTRLRRLLAAKWKTLQDDPQARPKLIRFAIGRGFSYEAVQDEVDALVRADQAICDCAD